MTNLPFAMTSELPAAVLDTLPNPVLVKNEQLQYVWTNRAFEDLFNVQTTELVGHTDKEVFRKRQAVQCAGGDLRVLESGGVDEAYETVFKNGGESREMITRKSRLQLANGSVYLVGVMHDVTEVTQTNRRLEEHKRLLEEQSDELHRMAHTDALTGCLNRRALFEEASKTFEPFNNVGALLVMDIDFFKEINDSWGHDGGDAVLRHFVDVVQHNIRDNDRLARIGGEEFALLLPGASEEVTQAITNRICSALHQCPLLVNQTEVRMTVSIGATLKGDQGPLDLDEWLPIADSCLYQAKHAGRDQVVFAEA